MYEISIFHVIQMYLGVVSKKKIIRGTKCLCCSVIPRLSG